MYFFYLFENWHIWDDFFKQLSDIFRSCLLFPFKASADGFVPSPPSVLKEKSRISVMSSAIGRNCRASEELPSPHSRSKWRHGTVWLSHMVQYVFSFLNECIHIQQCHAPMVIWSWTQGLWPHALSDVSLKRTEVLTLICEQVWRRQEECFCHHWAKHKHSLSCQFSKLVNVFWTQMFMVISLSVNKNTALYWPSFQQPSSSLLPQSGHLLKIHYIVQYIDRRIDSKYARESK